MCPRFRLAASVSWCWSWEKGGESSWFGPWHLGCTLEVFHVHSYQDQFIQPSWTECVFFCVFSLGLYFVYSFVFLLFVCVSPSFYVSLSSWVISLTVFHAWVTNLNEPPTALAASTIAWVIASSLLGRCKQKQRGLRGLLCRWPSITEWEMHITTTHHCSGSPSPKWPILCRVGR